MLASYTGICDQLTTLGVEFSQIDLTNIFISALRYSAAHPYPVIPSPSILIPSWIWTTMLKYQTPIPWASCPIPCPPPRPHQHRDTTDCSGKDHHPNGPYQELWTYHGRNWGLGQTRLPSNWLIRAAGTIVRRPGCFMRVDPNTNTDTEEPLLNTNERIHSSVRLRLACKGMGMDDRGAWTCPSLLTDDSHHSKPLWKLEKGNAINSRELSREQAFWKQEVTKEGYDGVSYEMRQGDAEWRWTLQPDGVVKNNMGKEVTPAVRILPEEPMIGYWERHFLALTRGEVDVWRLAESDSLAVSSAEQVV